MSRTVIDVHAIQTVPPSNLNRDDTGSPKTAVFGGVTRARVSSQAWKRAIRKEFKDVLEESDLGRRTKQVVEALAARIAALDEGLNDDATELAIAAFKDAGVKIEAKKTKKTDTTEEKTSHESGYLLFLSNNQYDKLARAVVAAARSGEKSDKKALRQIIDSDHSVDIALFGRMVADLPDINVDAACQVAHAISVHGVANEFDYFTAVDDSKQDAEETGAGMIGTVEFNSSTLYRYATVDVDALRRNLGDDTATVRAVKAFVSAFITSMPSGKQNTFANRTLPDAVVVSLRDSQSVNYAAAFEVPVEPEDKSSRIAKAAEELRRYATETATKYDALAPLQTWVLHVGDTTAAVAELGESMTQRGLLDAIETAVAERITS
ncbi:CRISPR system Cascade subunit CasC [Stackebrandtia albiflava]|uniref:CRISPR system Cascade subunit CasC n=1 Tax=Stackebrandtia albiflava TaxID=406432 RepID=A0A562UR93_9ACTN|nr:type I-E CRISPR-associated protein Cas7/Cse4/CasC [Stackebrandtia albiflava]TWJ08142.1 CRISPR system Cascade subunit CasC [Stackebrandtia albiflava]